MEDFNIEKAVGDDGKWETVSSEYLFRRPWLTVRHDQVRLPDGRINPEFYVLEYPDWVNVIAVTEDGEFVMERQYRHGLGKTCYEIPAGVMEKGETPLEAAQRELKEETGLDFTPADAPEMYCKPFFTTIGMTDESCGTIYGYASGTVSKAGQEENEEIEIVLADKAEVRRILKEENVAIMCAYMLMHFLQAEPGHAFDFLKI